VCLQYRKLILSTFSFSILALICVKYKIYRFSNPRKLSYRMLRPVVLHRTDPRFKSHQGLVIELVWTSEKAVRFYGTKRRNNTEDSHLHTGSGENIKYHTFLICLFTYRPKFETCLQNVRVFLKKLRKYFGAWSAACYISKPTVHTSFNFYSIQSYQRYQSYQKPFKATSWVIVCFNGIIIRNILNFHLQLNLWEN
jgi:hypothetical protein